MGVKLNLILAACQNLGIGKNGDLPWRLKNEMAYFSRMTTQVKDPTKQNAVIMGRKTWDSVPLKYRPFKNRLNVVLSRNPECIIDDKSVLKFENIDAAVKKLTSEDSVEKIWVIGGSEIYKCALESAYDCRVYMTRIYETFDCDTFFPDIFHQYVAVKDADVPTEIQEEKNIKYQFFVYEKRKTT